VRKAQRDDVIILASTNFAPCQHEDQTCEHYPKHKPLKCIHLSPKNLNLFRRTNIACPSLSKGYAIDFTSQEEAGLLLEMYSYQMFSMRHKKYSPLFQCIRKALQKAAISYRHPLKRLDSPRKDVALLQPQAPFATS
jgi:hypothetical protein